MTANERLGFEGKDRLVVVHVDDIGMSGAANEGAVRALDGAARTVTDRFFVVVNGTKAVLRMDEFFWKSPCFEIGKVVAISQPYPHGATS